MAKQQDETTNTSRREFFRTALVATGAAALAATGRATATAPQTETVAPASKTETQGYHVTDHIREYYRVASL
jgi:nitrous oxide reductase